MARSSEGLTRARLNFLKPPAATGGFFCWMGFPCTAGYEKCFTLFLATGLVVALPDGKVLHTFPGNAPRRVASTNRYSCQMSAMMTASKTVRTMSPIEKANVSR